MSGIDYTALASTVRSILTDLGQSVTLRQKAAGAYDPAAGGATLTPTDSSLAGAAFDYNEGQQPIRGNPVVTATDKRVLLASTGAVPVVGDAVLIGGIEYAVLSVGEVNPAGTRVLFDLHVRK